MELVDTHAHLDDEQFAGEEAEVVERARAAGVVQVIAIGTTARSSLRAVELARRFPGVFAAVGIHPNHASEASPDDWHCIDGLAGLPEVVAIGETGLDRHRQYTPFALQEEFFRRHLELARRAERPFVVHCRDAGAEVLAWLREAAQEGARRGVMHSFTGDTATAQACLDLGLYLSFAGMVTYKKSAALREVARLVPVDRLLVETDAPYLSPEPLRGRRNEPAHLVHTVRFLADLRGVAAEELAQQTTANARRLFRLPEPAS